MKTQHIIIAAVVLIVLAVVAAIANVYARNKSNSTPLPEPGKDGTATPVVLDYDKKLGIGSSGAEVQELQRLYNLTPHIPKLDEDGKFGPKTLNAVIKVMGFGTTSTTLKAFKAKAEQATGQAANESFIKKLFGL